MELRHNNQSYTVEHLSEGAKEKLARSIAFSRDEAIGNLALLGFPADHEYKPEEREIKVKAETFADTHRGFRIEH